MFLARVFGIFNEKIVRIWCEAPWSRFSDLGRPRIIPPGGGKAYSLDFTLQSQDKSTFVAEMKCWVGYQNYKLLTLQNAEQLDELEGPAFNAFKEVAINPSRCKVSVDGTEQPVDGAILIWGDVAEAGRIAAKHRYKIFEVLSLKDIIDELIARKHQPYFMFLDERRRWCEHLYRGLAKG